ncbi:Formiminotransferase domain protein [Hydrogenobacter thermophilus TK-6]|uniref:PpiC domain-containing protein n=2 Tax=Hydrogenobacter thermophilus TaxID=940 RepID=D3DG25_HYDTT|nr:peptidylprolyl isomerase [Hydrogenobacter thermophilus]ADO44712.1 Formiminotransferase domain protein [Hydrogenobacter thermophilus TK-6]BAI68777.1 hypothetical protein HTH_0310 [Hydrogenobacter thermophilus TK-6]
MYTLIQKHKTLLVFIVTVASGAFFLWLFFTGSVRDITSVGKKCVAEVNGSCITLRDYRRELLRFSNIQSRDLEEVIKKQVIENLITQELLYQKARSLGFYASDEEVVSVIKSDPTFQEGGVFSASKYKEMLARLGLEPGEYEDYIRRMLTVQKLLALVSNSVYLSEAEKNINLAVQSTLLSGKLYIITPSDVEVSYTPTQEEMMSFYEKNKELFRRPEKKLVRVWAEKDKAKVEEIYRAIKEGKQVQGYTEYLLPDDANRLPKGVSSEVSKLDQKDGILVTKEGDEYLIVYLYRVEPAGIRSFEEVKEQIRSALIDKRKASLLRDKAQEIYKRLTEGKDVSVKYLTFEDTPVDQIMSIAKVKEGQVVSFILSKQKVFGPYELSQGYGVFVITDRKKKPADEEEIKKLTQDILNMKSDATVNYLIEHLIRSAKIKINEEVIKGGA